MARCYAPPPPVVCARVSTHMPAWLGVGVCMHACMCVCTTTK